jgi:hypothetical protein
MYIRAWAISIEKGMDAPTVMFSCPPLRIYFIRYIKGVYHDPIIALEERITQEIFKNCLVMNFVVEPLKI